jgi:hypothetical protein
MSRLIISCIAILSFFGCKGEKSESILPKTIKIDLDSGEPGNFSDFIENLRYHLVKTDSLNFLVSPYKIVANDSSYFIEDSFQKKVFFYNKYTNNYAVIGTHGEGPGENLELDDFSIHNNMVTINDSKLKKFITYHFDGEFKQEVKSLYHRSIFYQGENFKLLYSHSDPEVGYRIIREERSKEVNGYLKVEDWFAQKITRDQNGFVYCDKLKRIFFLLPYTNEIAIFDEHGELVELIKIDFGKYAFTKDHWSKFKDFNSQIKYASENKLVFQINSFLVLENFFVISVNQEGGASHLIVLNHDFNLLNHFTNLNNDIDNVKIAAIPWSAYSNKFLFIVNSKRFLNDNNSLIEGKANVSMSNISQFMKSHGDDLSEDEYQVIIEVGLK